MLITLLSNWFSLWNQKHQMQLFCSLKCFWDATVVSWCLPFAFQHSKVMTFKNANPTNSSGKILHRGLAGACVLADCWDTSRLGSVKIPFQLQWSMSFEGYVVVFWPLNAYKCHGCCKNLILLVLGAGFPCKRERTQRDCTVGSPRWESKLHLMIQETPNTTNATFFLFVVGLYVCAEACISETLNHSGWKHVATFPTGMFVL